MVKIFHAFIACGSSKKWHLSLLIGFWTLCFKQSTMCVIQIQIRICTVWLITAIDKSRMAERNCSGWMKFHQKKKNCPVFAFSINKFRLLFLGKGWSVIFEIRFTAMKWSNLRNNRIWQQILTNDVSKFAQINCTVFDRLLKQLFRNFCWAALFAYQPYLFVNYFAKRLVL